MDIRSVEQLLIKNGWERWGNETFIKDKLLLRVRGVLDDYTFELCHKRYFDRWANSRFVRIELFGGSINADPEILFEKLKDASYIFRKLKQRLFTCGIRICL